MIYVGIDVASKKHDFYIMNHNGECIPNVITIENNMEGYKKLHNSIKNFVEQTNDYEVCIGLESTGHYSKNITTFLLEIGYEVFLINPLLTNMERASTSLRKTKTDKIDSQTICMFLMKNKANLRPSTITSYHSEGIKSLSRLRFSLVKQQTVLKQKFIRQIDLVFPEYNDVFSNIYSKSSLEVLHSFPTPDALLEADFDDILAILKKASRGRHKGQKVDELKNLAANTVGKSNIYDAIEMKSLIALIINYQNQIESLEIEIEKLVNEHFSNILSIPGVGVVIAGILIGEIGDISRFKSADALLAYAGLDPVVYQSGNYNANNVKISKRGSKYLRWAIHQASSKIAIYDSTFKNYLKNKRSQGKHYYTSLGHVGKKFTRVLYSILKNNIMFVSQN